MSADTLAQLERLRLFRGRRERDTSIAPLVNAVERDLKRQDRAVGGADAAWGRLVPAELLRLTRVVSFARGTLVVAAHCSATAFELDRALRGGLENELRAALRAGSLRVRVRVGI
jgi:Dna[CI] antecedent, DciA